MRLLRRIGNVKQWSSYMMGEERGSAHAPPIFVLDELYDKQLSVYGATDDIQAAQIAAALCFAAGGPPKPVVFSYTSLDRLKALGLGVVKSEGETGIPWVNGLHFHVETKSLEDFHGLIDVFTESVFTVELPVVKAAMVEIIATNALDYGKIAQAKDASVERKVWASASHLAGFKLVEFRKRPSSSVSDDLTIA